MYQLGRVNNALVSTTTGKTPISMVDCTTVTIYAIGATSGNATVTQAKSAALASEVNYDGSDAAHGDGITSYYRWNSGTWTLVTQAVAATFTCGTGGLAACEIDATQLSDGFTFLTVSHASASFVVVQGGLVRGRVPTNLRSNIA